MGKKPYGNLGERERKREGRLEREEGKKETRDSNGKERAQQGWVGVAWPEDQLWLVFLFHLPSRTWASSLRTKLLCVCLRCLRTAYTPQSTPGKEHVQYPVCPKHTQQGPPPTAVQVSHDSGLSVTTRKDCSFTPQSTEHNKLKKVCPKAARAAGRLCSPGVGSFTETEKEKLTGRRTYCRGCKTTALTDFLWFVNVTLVFPATRSHNRIVVSWLPVMRRHTRTERQRQTDMGRIHKLEYSKHDVLLCTHTH